MRIALLGSKIGGNRPNVEQPGRKRRPNIWGMGMQFRADKVATQGLSAVTRTGKLLVGATLAVGLLGSSSAWAQCRDNFNYAFIDTPGPGGIPVAAGFPLGGGSSLSALTSTINTINTAFLTSTSAFVSSPGNPQPNQQGGGVWARTIGGTVDSEQSSRATLTVPPGVVPAATGVQNCDTSTRQDYWGYQVGKDISILNGGGTGANWHFGVTAGYLEAQTKDKTGASNFVNPFYGPAFIPAGTLGVDTQVPFAGIYTAFTVGSLALDAQARWDFYQNTITEPLNGLFNQRLDAQGFSLTGNASYNIPLASGWFVEPSAGVVWSRVEVDTLAVAGVPLFVPGVGTVNVGAGTLAVQDVESVLGRASIRVGTNFNSGGVLWQPFFTASIFHEFAGDVSARAIESNFGGFELAMRSEGGVGTYAQFGLGTAAALGNSGWLAYARSDYRIGEQIEGVSVNAGLRYQFSPEHRGSIKDGPAAIPTYNWSGPYIGAFAGGTWGEQDWVFLTGPPSRLSPDFAGYHYGGQAGYNIQFGQLVAGIEGEYGLSNAHGGMDCPNAAPFTCNADVHSLAFLTGRLGTTWGRALFYAKGGLAFGEVTAGATDDANPIGGIGASTTHWSTGWVAGVGMEFALTQKWSAKAEYLHYDLGSERYQVSTAGAGEFVKAETTGESVRVGVNYHFHREHVVPLK